MKRFLLFALSIVALCGIARADRGVAIDFEQLPQKAQLFISDNFPNAAISFVTQERDGDYNVYFTTGVKVEFDRYGDWDKVKGPGIPFSIAPAAIQNFLNGRHPGVQVMEIERDLKHNEIEVKLANGIEIEFYLNGAFKRYDR